MNTTELFAEQVLIGLLVILTGGLVFLHRLEPLYNDLSSKDSLFGQLLAGGLVLGAAYLVGMVYDRVADTLLQDLESHCRLQFALARFEIGKGKKLKQFKWPDHDPFEEGKYRIQVLANEQATAQADYYRSRVRLTRAMTTILPATTIALLLAIDYRSRGLTRGWVFVAALVPIVYAGVFGFKWFSKLLKRPPKTYDINGVRAYMQEARMLQHCPARPRHMFLVFWADEVLIGLGILLLLASVLIVSSGSYYLFWILMAGLMLTIVVGWSWWRISKTFYAFLRDYNQYRPGQ